VRGRSERGERLASAVPHGHWKITTFVAGPRHDGLTAPFVIDRPMNGAICLTYVEQCLASTLSPGDIVVMDNLPAHKVPWKATGETDSSAEEDGFELAVPPRRERLWGATPGKHCRLRPEPVSGSALPLPRDHPR
jgi:hypothetical protein